MAELDVLLLLVTQRANAIKKVIAEIYKLHVEQ
jgi:hypothetical protein